MDMETALHNLGVREDTLSDEEKTSLDEKGYVPFYDFITQDQLSGFKERLDEIASEEGDEAGLEVHQQPGTVRLANLVNKDPMFEICFTHPRTLGAVKYVLTSNFKFHSLNSRAALPGEGNQDIHPDWGDRVEPGDYYVCNSIWLVDEFTEENGATRIVPGSHLSKKIPKDQMEDPRKPHPDEVKLIAPAGTVIVFNSHAWHGGTQNRSSSLRRAIHSAFVRRDQSQQTDQKKHILPETYNRLSEEARFILDV